MLRKWDDLPKFMKCDEVKEYYDILIQHKMSLKLKRVFDLIVSIILIIICAFPMIIIAVMIVVDSKGGIFYRQERVTAYGKKFKIHKFRTMIENADKIGSTVTINEDSRVTRVGKFLRKYRLDELPQLLDVIVGDMTFVGTRPECAKYVKRYTPKMRATLLLPAGITSEASIHYKNEAALLDLADDIDKVYVEKILPNKMKYNLESIRRFNIFGEILTMLRTVFVVIEKVNE